MYVVGYLSHDPEKTGFRSSSDQVRHKRACTVTAEDYKLETLDFKI